MSSAEFSLATTPIEKGVSLLEAGAGTGKTYTIAGLVLRLIVEENIPIQEILIVTFTEAATEELKSRVRSYLQNALTILNERSTEGDELVQTYQTDFEKRDEKIRRIRLALGTFDEASIFTILGFCNRVLKDSAFSSGTIFDSTILKDPGPYLLDCATDLWRSKVYPSDSFVLSLMNYLKFTPETIVGLYEETSKLHACEIIPAVSDKRCDGFQEMLKNMWLKMQTTWLSEKDAIISLFKDPKNFKVKLRNASPDILSTLSNDLPELPSIFIIHILAHLTVESVEGGKMKKAQFDPQGFEFFKEVSEFYELLNTWQHQFKFSLLHQFEESLEQRKEEKQVLTFNDLLKGVLNALNSSFGPLLKARVSSQYQAALVDEFQDTDPGQFNLFKQFFITPDHYLFLIGDPKQSIYSFRGADIFSYLNARNIAANVYTLSRNWRSEEFLIEGVNKLFQNNTVPFVFSEIPYQPATAAETERDDALFENLAIQQQPVNLCFLRSVDGKAISKAKANPIIREAVVREILRLLNGNFIREEADLSPGDIAILTRSNREASEYREMLQQYKLPSVIHSEKTVFETDEANALTRLLKAIDDPKRSDWIRATLTEDWFKKTATDLLNDFNDSDSWESIHESFLEAHGNWRAYGISNALTQWIRHWKLKESILSLPDGERKLTNLLHLIELLHKAEREQHLSPRAIIDWIEKNIESPDRERDDFLARMEKDDTAIQIVTIHKSKGLEYPIVFIPSAWGTRYKMPDVLKYHTGADLEDTALDYSSEKTPSAIEQFEKESLSDELRLLYVALTRAQNRCYLFWGEFAKQHESSIGYLMGLNESETNPLEKLEEFKSSAPTRIQFRDAIEMAEQNYTYYNTKVSQDPLEKRSSSRHIRSGFSISSFSAITHGMEDSLHLTGITDEDTSDDTTAILDQNNIFTLPKGSVTGNLIHNVLENTDFNDPESLRTTLAKECEKNQWAADWKNILNNQLQQVLSKTLQGDNESFKLSDLAPSRCFKEMEFHFPSQGCSTTSLASVYSKKDVPEAFIEHLHSLKAQELKGYLRGFIDLTFEHNGKYYILDWKSNWLGNSPKHYGVEQIKESMASHSYFLQYYIYTLALHRYLKNRLPAYSYENNFGGVFYIYVRGVTETENNGIFFDKPAEQTIDKLDNLFRTEVML